MHHRQRLMVRPLERGDLEIVSGWLADEGFALPAGTSFRLWGDRLCSDPGIVCRAGLVGGSLVGLVRLDIGPDACAEVTVLVAPAWRRRRHGRTLLEQALGLARQRALRRLVAEVRETNRGARAFFESAGFVDTGHRLAEFVQLEWQVPARAPWLEVWR